MKEQLYQAILDGLGTDDPEAAWVKFKAELRQGSYSTDSEVLNGRDVVSALKDGSHESQIKQIINLCVDCDNGLILLRNACKIFRSSTYRKNAESILQAIAEQLPNQPAFRTDLAPMAPTVFVDLTWIDDLNQASCAQARHVVEAMARPGEPLADDDQVEKFLSIPASQVSKSDLEKLLKNKNQSVVDEFRIRLKVSDPGDPQRESSQFLYIIVQPVECSETLYRFKAELVEQGAKIPLRFELERENNGAWPECSIADLPAYIVRCYGAANRRAVDRLSMEVFLPSKLLAECHDFKIEIPESEPESSTRMLNLVYDCPYVLRSSDRALSAQKGDLGPLRRKWQSLLRGASVLHCLSDDSELDQDPFHSLLKQDYLAGILIPKNLPDDEGMRSRLIKKVIDSGTPLLVWYHDTPKDDVIEFMEKVLDKFAQCLDLNSVQRDARGRIKAPIHLCKTERAAHRRFDLAADEDCKSWIHRVNILHDHPDRWPQQILYEKQPSGKASSEIHLSLVQPSEIQNQP